jgi:hypothetical protein
MTSDGDMRASDRDRDCAGAALREAYTAGRLDAEEFHERLDAAYAAKTWGELRELTADLPEGAVLAAKQVAGRPYHEKPELLHERGRPFAPLWGMAVAWLVIAGVAHVLAAIPLVLLALFLLRAAYWRAPLQRRTRRAGDLTGGLVEPDPLHDRFG